MTTVSIGEEVEELSLKTLLVGTQNVLTTQENILAVPCKVKHTPTLCDSATPCSGNSTKKMKTYVYTNT